MAQSPTGDQEAVTAQGRSRSTAKSSKPPTSAHQTRRGQVAASRPVGAPGAQSGSPVPFVLLGVGVLVFGIGVAIFFSGGKPSVEPVRPHTPEATAESIKSEPAPAKSAPTPASTVSTPAPPVSTPTSPPVAPATFRPPTLSETDAQAKFNPLRDRFARARQANDLKEMGAVAGDLGLITRDYDGTETAKAAMDLIKIHKELRATEDFNTQCAAPFREATAKATRMNEDLDDILDRVVKFGRSRKDTDAGTKALDLVKNWREQSAQQWWDRLKSKLEGDEPKQSALVEAGILNREFSGTPGAGEAVKQFRAIHQKLLDKQGPSAWLHMLKDVVLAPGTRELRGAIQAIHTYKGAQIAPPDARLDELQAEACKALMQSLAPRDRPKELFKIPQAHRLGEFFSPLDGCQLKKDKEGETQVAAITSKAGQAGIQILYPTSFAEEQAVFKVEFKSNGLKRVFLRLFSSTHQQVFEHELKDAKGSAWNTATVELSKVKHEGLTLRNAWIGLMILEGEKSDPSKEDAALLIKSAELTTGRK
ncbi:MAG: hypothetical protein HS116_05340 [Planctomycetes bacterium]|nr:hypothetical protein [Planctomycetota bacterium]